MLDAKTGGGVGRISVARLVLQLKLAIFLIQLCTFGQYFF